MSENVVMKDSKRHVFLTGAMYAAVAALIFLGWRYAELDLIEAGYGVGYALGIAGTTLMALLLLYPLRKRLRFLHRLGPVRYWFRTHMVFGILGPLLIIFHSNFDLGSLNSRIALFCTLVVAASGIVGRYLYAQLHYGLYGREATLASLRKNLSTLRDEAGGVAKLMPSVEAELAAWEDQVLDGKRQVAGAFAEAFAVSVTSRGKLRRWQQDADAEIAHALNGGALGAHAQRLRRASRDYLQRRTSLLRKIAQYRAFERLFSLWHIVHYPLFLLLIVAVVVHIVAVHMY